MAPRGVDHACPFPLEVIVDISSVGPFPERSARWKPQQEKQPTNRGNGVSSLSRVAADRSGGKNRAVHQKSRTGNLDHRGPERRSARRNSIESNTRHLRHCTSAAARLAVESDVDSVRTHDETDDHSDWSSEEATPVPSEKSKAPGNVDLDPSELPQTQPFAARCRTRRAAYHEMQRLPISVWRRKMKKRLVAETTQLGCIFDGLYQRQAYSKINLRNTKGRHGKSLGIVVSMRVMALFAAGRANEAMKTVGGDYHVSHLCHQSRCIRSDHLVVEKPDYNSRRNDCQGRTDGRLCTHRPQCLLPSKAVARENNEVVRADLPLRRISIDSGDGENFAEVARPCHTHRRGNPKRLAVEAESRDQTPCQEAQTVELRRSKRKRTLTQDCREVARSIKRSRLRSRQPDQSPDVVTNAVPRRSLRLTYEAPSSTRQSLRLKQRKPRATWYRGKGMPSD